MSSASDKALADIRNDIIAGRHGPGSHLKEEELALRSGVSRTSIRDALRRLAAEGLVQSSPNRGTFVASFSDADVDELFRLRSALEAYGAALAATRITSDELTELERLEQQLEQLARRSPTDLDEFARLNNAFHKLVLSAARSPRLEAMLGPLIDIPVVLLKHYTWQGKVDPARSNQHHREIIQALRARDPIWARSRMQAHIISTRPHPQAEDDSGETSLNLGVEFD